MDIKNYSKKNLHKETNKNDKNIDDLKTIQQNHKELVDEFMKRYGRMSEKQMLDEMFKLIKQKKDQGTFDINQIKDIAEKVAPFLDESQQEYMRNLLEKLD